MKQKLSKAKYLIFTGLIGIAFVWVGLFTGHHWIPGTGERNLGLGILAALIFLFLHFLFACLLAVGSVKGINSIKIAKTKYPKLDITFVYFGALVSFAVFLSILFVFLS